MKNLAVLCLIASCLSATAAPSFSQVPRSSDTFMTLTRPPHHRASLPTNISVITHDDIKRNHAQTIDEVLLLAPAVDVQRARTLGSFSTVRMRGATSSAQVQIVLDDQPVEGISRQFFDLSRIPV